MTHSNRSITIRGGEQLATRAWKAMASIFLILMACLVSECQGKAPIYIKWDPTPGGDENSPTNPLHITDEPAFTTFLQNHGTNWTIYYAPGTYLTKGHQWGPFTDTNTGIFYPSRTTAGRDCRHYGAGTNQTIIKLVGSDHPTANGIIFGSREPADGFEVKNMTLDCNAAGNPKFINNQPGACTAISIGGSYITLSDLHVIGFGTKAPRECFPVYVQGALNMTNVVMERVVFRSPAPNSTDGMSTANIAPEDGKTATGVVIRNCTVYDVASAFPYSHGFLAPLMESNIVSGCGIGVYLEPGSGSGFDADWVIRRNTFTNVHAGIYLQYVGGAFAKHVKSILAISNTIVLKKDSTEFSGGPCDVSAGFAICDVSPGGAGSLDILYLANNLVKFSDGLLDPNARNGGFLFSDTVTATAIDNQIQLGTGMELQVNPLDVGMSVTASGNTDASSNPLSVTPFVTFPVISTSPQSQTLYIGQQANFSVVAGGGALRYQWRFNSQDIPGATGSTYSIPSVSQSDSGTYTVVVRNPTGSLISAPATLQAPPLPVTSAAASFIAVDSTTHGDWKNRYGEEGYKIIGESSGTFFPPSIQVGNPSPFYQYIWDTFGAKLGSLQRVQAPPDRIAASWSSYPYNQFEFEINSTDALSHQLAIYCFDWNGLVPGRTEKIEIVDFVTGAVLDSRSVASFEQGKYLIWQFVGRIKVRVINTGPANSVISGIFIDPCTVSFLEADSTTQGNWKPKFGGQGYNIVGDSVSLTYAQAAPVGPATFLWDPSGIPALERGLTLMHKKVAACWYSGSQLNDQFAIDVRFNDGQWHKVAIYCFDGNPSTRNQDIRIRDKLTGAILYSANLTNFASGRYLVWRARGRLQIEVVNKIQGINALVNGVFFGAYPGTP